MFRSASITDHADSFVPMEAAPGLRGTDTLPMAVPPGERRQGKLEDLLLLGSKKTGIQFCISVCNLKEVGPVGRNLAPPTPDHPCTLSPGSRCQPRPHPCGIADSVAMQVLSQPQPGRLADFCGVCSTHPVPIGHGEDQTGEAVDEGLPRGLVAFGCRP